MMMTTELKPWSSLTTAEQIELRADYQRDLEHQPLTCSIDEKVSRFADWLEQHGVSFSRDDLKLKERTH